MRKYPFNLPFPPSVPDLPSVWVATKSPSSQSTNVYCKASTVLQKLAEGSQSRLIVPCEAHHNRKVPLTSFWWWNRTFCMAVEATSDSRLSRQDIDQMNETIDLGDGGWTYSWCDEDKAVRKDVLLYGGMVIESCK